MNGYFLQMAAYSQAHDFLYSDHAIEQICVFNVHGTDPDSIKTSVFSVSGNELLDKIDSFNNRVK
jgi:hypothetical protein